jgi:hypothetical protein
VVASYMLALVRRSVIYYACQVAVVGVEFGGQEGRGGGIDGLKVGMVARPCRMMMAFDQLLAACDGIPGLQRATRVATLIAKRATWGASYGMDMISRDLEITVVASAVVADLSPRPGCHW